MGKQAQIKTTPNKTIQPKANKNISPGIRLSRSNRDMAVYLLFGFVALLYANSLFNQYALDDRLAITENAFTKKGLDGIKDILTHDSFVGFFGKQKNLVAGGRYRPLSLVTFAIEYAIVGFNPFIAHLINLILYALTGVLLYKVLKMLFPPGNKKFYLTISFLATALFIAHPLHTEAVANIKGRDEIMSLLGALGTLYFILKYAQSGKPAQLIAALLIFFLGMMSKENAITFVAVIPLTLYFFTKTETKRVLISTLALLVMAVVFIVIRTKVLGYLMSPEINYELLNNPFVGATPMQKFATILLTWGKYLLLILFPHPLTHDYYPKQIPIIEFGDYRAIIPMLIYALMIVYAFARFAKKDIISYCILFFGLTFSISSNLIFPVGTFMNDRFMFIPLLGFCIAVAYMLIEKLPVWMNNNNAQKAMMFIAGLILLGYSVKTIARNPAWKDDYTLFTTDVNVSTNSAKCNVSAGGQTLELAEKTTDPVKKAKMIEDAVLYLNRGVSIHPTYAAGWVLLGKAMVDKENYKQARICYENVLKINPKQKEALNNWVYCAQASLKNQDYKEALESYLKLISYNPSDKDLYIGLAGVYEKMNRIDSVLAITKWLLAKDPNFAPALSKTGEMYGKYLNNLDKSLEYLLKAYSISPTDASLLENIGVAYGMQKNYLKSIEFFTKAKDIKPDNPQIYLNLAGSYMNMGNKESAEYQVKAAEVQKANKK